MAMESRMMQDHLLGKDVRIDGVRIGQCTGIRFEQDVEYGRSALCTRHKAVIEVMMDCESQIDLSEYYQLMEVMA